MMDMNRAKKINLPCPDRKAGRSWLWGSVFLVAVSLFGIVVPAEAGCVQSAQRNADVDAKEISTVRIRSMVGSLTIIGKPGSETVNAYGKACASTDSDLEKVQVTASREGDLIQVVSSVPGSTMQEKKVRNKRDVLSTAPEDNKNVPGPPAKKEPPPEGSPPEESSAYLNLTVEIPAALPVELELNWGDADIRSVHSVNANLERSNVTADDIASDIILSVGTGEVRLTAVKGNVKVNKGPGDMVIKGTGGEVTVERNQFGELQILDTRGNVLIKEDGPGDIKVLNAKGNLVIEKDAGGSIVYRDIGGKVTAPKAGPPKEVRERLEMKHKKK